MSSNTETDAPPAEVRLERREVFRGNLLNVYVDRVRSATGRESTREIVEHPGAVAIVAVTDENQVLLIRQFRYAVGTVLLEIPAGTCEEGEDPRVTAERELSEEIGYRAGAIREISTFFSSAGFLTERLRLFLAEGCTSIEGQEPDHSHEGIELVVTPIAKVPELLASGEVQDAMTLIGLLWLLNDRRHRRHSLS